MRDASLAAINFHSLMFSFGTKLEVLVTSLRPQQPVSIHVNLLETTTTCFYSCELAQSIYFGDKKIAIL